MQVTINIPDDLVSCLQLHGTDAGRGLLEEAAAAAYRDRRLTSAQLRRLLDLETRMEVEAFLSRHCITDYTVGDLNQDMESLGRLRA